jgi:hypothetical protein
MLFCQDIEIRRRAVHEAGHAVFMWRGGETIYGDRFNDRLAPFDEILVNPYDFPEKGRSMPPLRLEDGRTELAKGAVVSRGRPRVPDVRRMTGPSRAKHRTLIAEAKLRAQVSMIDLLAGPVVETHFCAAWKGYEPIFDWLMELEHEEANEFNGDVRQAFAIAEQELCRGHQQTVATMNNAVQRIQAKLDGEERYLRAIEALADALSKQFRLDHDEAVAVMCAAWSMHTPEGRRTGR